MGVAIAPRPGATPVSRAPAQSVPPTRGGAHLSRCPKLEPKEKAPTEETRWWGPCEGDRARYAGAEAEPGVTR